MTRVYYKEAVGAMVVFDVTRVTTFEAVQKWKNDIDAKVLLPPDNRPIPVVLLANKCDLAKEGICEDKRQMDKFCEEHGFIGWFETSAKDDVGIEDASKHLVGKILENDTTRGSNAPKKPSGVSLDARPAPQQKDSGCC
mmetsp:Transcript_28788/g.40486  ORF Transcript_28788/g.40486 Transcript_28788/m.40486 type:complete len:139 (+) Transcript_28788:325-741(+)